MARADPPKRRTPPERSGMRLCKRDARGLLLPMDALERFREKCRFDPTTGCVLWTGGTTQGRGNTAIYGSFWYEGRRWFAHRWAARFIHGLEIDGLQVGHNCPHTADRHPNTLCVEHVAGQTQLDNLAEQMERGTGCCAQSSDTRQFWLFVDRGYEPAPPAHDPSAVDPAAIPFFTPPAWLAPARQLETTPCPF
jgi:hypothetical protein